MMLKLTLSIPLLGSMAFPSLLTRDAYTTSQVLLVQESRCCFALVRR